VPELGPQQKQKPTDGEGDPKCWMKSSLGELLVQNGFKNRPLNEVTKHKSPIITSSVHYHFLHRPAAFAQCLFFGKAWQKGEVYAISKHETR